MNKCDGNHGGPPCGDPECWNGVIANSTMNPGSRDFSMTYNQLLIVESALQKALGSLSRNDGPMAVQHMYAASANLQRASKLLKSEFNAKQKKE